MRDICNRRIGTICRKQARVVKQSFLAPFAICRMSNKTNEICRVIDKAMSAA
jgi:hypothetical protein